MAFIDGGYTKVKQIMGDLADIFSDANKLAPLVENEKHKVIDDGGLQITLKHMPLDPANFVWTLNGSPITPVIVHNAGEQLVQFTSGVNVDDEIEVSYEADRNWIIVYPLPRVEDDDLNPLDTPEKVRLDQIARIRKEDRFVMKTYTTPTNPIPVDDPFNTDPDSTATTINMYVEFLKPVYCINPENGQPSSLTITPEGERVIGVPNNHYMLIRVIDKFDEVLGVPKQDAIISDWSKYSWLMDFKDELKDKYDKTPTETDSNVGLFLRPQKLPEFYNDGQLSVQYWISITNDRINMVLMGNPDIDYDNYLVSYCYIGRMTSFVDKITQQPYSNDVLGNFAITCGSATFPSKMPPDLDKPINVFNNNVLSTPVNLFSGDTLGINKNAGQFYDTIKIVVKEYQAQTDPPYSVFLRSKVVIVRAPEIRNSYRCAFINDKAQSIASNILSMKIYPSYLFKVDQTTVKTTPPVGEGQPPFDVWTDEQWLNKAIQEDETIITTNAEYEMQLEMDVIVPDSIKDTVGGLRVFKAIHADADEPEATLDSEFYMTDESSIDPASVTAGLYKYRDYGVSSIAQAVFKKLLWDGGMRFDIDHQSVFRDRITGSAVNTIDPDKFGEKTSATGVLDIAVYKTKMGAYWQKHNVSFQTMEEFIRKENFNPSKWTKRCHLSYVNVAHGGDGYRSYLMDVVMVDNTNIVNSDILIVNEGSTDPNHPEMKFKYFKVNAPYSFNQLSPNHAYGIAIRMI